ncbi:hypothetical protein [Algoriphagus sp. CAU 1675]|uniref:hypothetical protein n=1 Tax=Algoriphagus sp. CAU 1675 TaxID=3032597 RepID=UPI0023DC2253|nr:hypothetical protein [Algoriphagus sp. CAU 1675]MDF2157851.1 hypothetical protein [Algoriphagus sp. CAU 1675]
MSLIKARRADPGMEITTITSDGIETKKIAQEGEFLIENQTSTSELYLLGEEVMEKKYQITQSLDHGWATYKQKGFVFAFELNPNDLTNLGFNEILKYIAPWESENFAKSGDYMVIQEDQSEIHRIAKKEFEETYKEI